MMRLHPFARASPSVLCIRPRVARLAG